MSRFDEDLHPKIVSGPAHYDFGARGPVYAVSVVRNGETVGYLFHGDEGEPNAAGLIATTSGDFQPQGSAHWSAELRRLREADVPAADAVRSLLGAVGPAIAGTVGTELRRYDGKSALEAQLNPRPPVARERSAAPGSSRAAIDAALRGEAPLTPDLRERIERLDAALSAKPTPDDLVVALTRASARIPADLAAGSRVFEPSFLTSYLAKTGQRFPGVDTVVWLRVPSGTPAMFREASVAGDPGVLVLGRGLEWEVDRVLSSDEQTLVTAHIVDRRPATL